LEITILNNIEVVKIPMVMMMMIVAVVVAVVTTIMIRTMKHIRYLK